MLFKLMTMLKIQSLMLIGALFFCCQTSQETYQDFISEEIIYIGNPEEVIIGHGYEKLRFLIVINADPKIKKGFISSKNGNFTREFDVVRKNSGIDTISVDTDIPEGEYTFEILLSDDVGNQSIGYEVGSVVYGPRYQSTLLNRLTTIRTFATKAVFQWNPPTEGSLSTLLTYEDASGVIQEVRIDNSENETVISDFRLGGMVSIATTYEPSETSLEGFHAVPFETAFPEDFEMDKSIIVPIPLDFDADEGDLSAGKGIAILFDGKADSAPNQYSATREGAPSAYPFVMTFDVGFDSKLTAIRVDPRTDCCSDRAPSTFQVWGYTGSDIHQAHTVDIKTTELVDWEADAVAKGWIKLLDHKTTNSIPKTDITAIGDDRYRYLRFVALASQIAKPQADWFQPNFTELTFWSQ